MYASDPLSLLAKGSIDLMVYVLILSLGPLVHAKKIVCCVIIQMVRSY